MKAKSLLITALMSLSTVSAALAAPAATPFPTACDATYTSVDNHNGTNNSHYLSNGTGRTRKETTVNNSKTVIIVDYPTKMAYTIIESQKVVAKGPWRGDSFTDPGVLIKELGTQTVDGHVCVGVECAIKGGVKTSWTDKVTKVLVRSIVKGGSTERTTDITAYTPGCTRRQ